IHLLYFLFIDTTHTAIYTLSLHDALPIYRHSKACATTRRSANGRLRRPQGWQGIRDPFDTQVAVAFGLSLSTTRARDCLQNEIRDRKSTRLNSSHVEISYAVFCLKKKKMK